MEDLISQDEYFYHCEITEEHLITGRQEALMEAKNEEEMKWINEPICNPDEDDPEGWNDLRWYQKGKTSFAEKDFNDFIKRIKNYILQITKGKYILQHEDNKTYIIYENYHYWIKEKILTRLNVYIYRHAIIDQKEGFIEKILENESL